MKYNSRGYPDTFTFHASEVGRFILAARIKEWPVEKSAEILKDFKNSARLLKEACAVSHSQALEALSKASGFKSWYDFSSHINKSASFDGRATDEWEEKFLKVAPLLINVELDEKPSAIAIELITAFSTRLSEILNVERRVILDGLFAKLCHAGTWADVTTRHPLGAKDPYYYIVQADEFSEVHFCSTSACFQLKESLSDRFDHTTVEGVNAHADSLINTVTARPDYLDGWLELSYLFREEYPEAALKFANKGIEYAEALLPKGFRGKISCNYHENSTYLRLIECKILAHEVLIESDPRHINHAIKFTKKLIRRCPDLKSLWCEFLEEMKEAKEMSEDSPKNSL